MSRKVMKQGQEIGVGAIQIIKASKKMNSSLCDKYMCDDYDIDKSHNS